MPNRPLADARTLGLFTTAATLLLLMTSRPAQAAGEVGTVAPDFTINNLLAGPTSVTLSQYAGSVVCIAFFAEW